MFSLVNNHTHSSTLSGLVNPQHEYHDEAASVPVQCHAILLPFLYVAAVVASQSQRPHTAKLHQLSFT